MSTVWVDHKTPIELEKLRSLDYESLLNTLNDYKGGSNFREPGVEGLTRGVKELVKLDAEKIYQGLDKFVDLDIPYVYSFLDAFVELWEKEKEMHLPWDKIWPKLLDYINSIINKDKFWQWPEKRDDGAFVANHHWVVGIIGRLIESGCKTDDHSFHFENIDLSKSILCVLAQKEAGEKFTEDSEAVSIAINSPRGRCLEALINLALFTCRNQEALGIKHAEAWKKYQDIFDVELKKADEGEYEFATLVANYLHNFMYMSEEWVTKKLPIIFDQENYLRWLCAMQGYSYVSKLYPVIYDYLRESGAIIKALDDEHLKERLNDRYLQFISLAYLNDDEDLENQNSLISIILKRAKQNELRQVIWFLWTFREDRKSVV